MIHSSTVRVEILDFREKDITEMVSEHETI